MRKTTTDSAKTNSQNRANLVAADDCIACVHDGSVGAIVSAKRNGADVRIQFAESAPVSSASSAKGIDALVIVYKEHNEA